MLVHHYMKKSTQIISNPDYMGIVDQSNESLRKNEENDDDLRKKIFEGKDKSSNDKSGYISMIIFFNLDNDQKAGRSVTVIKSDDFKGNKENVDRHSQGNGHTNGGNENPFVKKFKNQTISNKKNVKKIC